MPIKMTTLTYDQKVVLVADASTRFAQDCAAFFAARGAKLLLNYPPGTSVRLISPSGGPRTKWTPLVPPK